MSTDLMGGADFGGMPLDAFADEVIGLLSAGDSPEILVQNVLPLRFAERDGTHQQIFEAMASRAH
ncbi:hypothetical protein QP157_08440 [Sphingomonas sp. LR61]|uniref:hypothetical protein n=1 Tax=Sphingomonas sp. LR61 TaxID=3050234 RepID=UPI002FE29923